ncbi:hypothetical protein E2C01_079461 [Portunus trituberculatus]|uniref:Uncharacterized protein n=1 Tax=Portunus trituberculatus TaxID=210409 RepID=A0A5B7IWY3_PORTR|nr:hypothetical protein [Portunus trituberculatus]
MHEGRYRRRQRGDSHILVAFITLGWPSSRRPLPYTLATHPYTPLITGNNRSKAPGVPPPLHPPAR